MAVNMNIFLFRFPAMAGDYNDAKWMSDSGSEAEIFHENKVN